MELTLYILTGILAVLVIQLYINHDQYRRLERLERWASSIRAVSKQQLKRDLDSIK